MLWFCTKIFEKLRGFSAKKAANKMQQPNSEYPADQFNKNFRVPKRKWGQTESYYDSGHGGFNQQNTPLANSYYNYPYDPNAASAYYGGYAQYNQTVGPNSGGTGASPVGDALKRNIFNALSDMKEKPKNERYSQNIFQQTVPDVIDETLPKDLKALFQPLFCKLCVAQLSSNMNAKMHYKSKNHEKKIKKWLIEYSEKTGEPLHKRAKPTNESQANEGEKNPSWFHCDICDLDLTGRLHAESHYMGKNHQRVLLGHKNPTGQGFYDDSGKWVRIKPQKAKSHDFENGEDNFGASFRKEEAAAAVAVAAPAQKKPAAAAPSKFHCDVCNINTTCQEQLDNHYRGQKHLKKLKQLGITNYTAQREPAEQVTSVTEAPEPVAALPASVPLGGDLNLSVYRLPSGDYYCPACNNTANSEAQFLQHLKSKNHMKKSQLKKNAAL